MYKTASSIVDVLLSGKTRSGNAWLKAVLCEVVWANARSQMSYLGAQFRLLCDSCGSIVGWQVLRGAATMRTKAADLEKVVHLRMSESHGNGWIRSADALAGE